MNVSELWSEYPIHKIRPFTEEEKWSIIKKYCHTLIVESDYTQLPDSGLSISKRMEWQIYRENLLSVQDDFSTPEDVIFPIEPAEE